MRARIACGLLAAVVVAGCNSETSTEQIAPLYETAAGSPVLTSNGSGVSIQKPSSAVIAEGSTLVLRAVQATSGSGRRVLGGLSWQSSNPAVVTVSPATGMVTAVAPGQAVVRLSVGLSLAAADSVSLSVAAAGAFQVSPATVSLQPRATMQMWSTSSSPVVWTSANSSVLSVTPAGMVTAVAVGTTTLIATNAAGTISTAPVTIVPPPAWLTQFSIKPKTISLNTGATQQFGVNFAWNDGTTTAPLVDYTATGGSISASGLYIAGTAPGTYRVIAKHQSSNWTDTSIVNIAAPVATLVQLMLTPATLAITAGAQQQFAVAGTWSDAGSSIPAATYTATGGTISPSGLFVAGGTPGTYRVIAAHAASGKADTTVVTVSAPVPTLSSLVMTPATATAQTGATQQFGVSALWSDAGTTVPTLTYTATGGTVGPTGLYTAGSTPGVYSVIVSALGKADTSVVTVNAPAATLTSVSITPKTSTVNTGATQQFGASALWSNGGTTVPTLSYSATGGTVNAAGLYTAGSTPGVYRVIVSALGKADTSNVTVSVPAPTLTSVSMTPATATVVSGATQQFGVTALWSNGATTVPTLSYAATGGSVSAGGLYTAGNIPGVYRVIVSALGKADTSSVTVNAPAPTLTSLTMTPGTLTITAGATQQFTTLALWSNGSTTVPTLTYVATGGTITAGGMFTAGSTPGTYRVIVSGGGLADTTSVVVNAAVSLVTLLDEVNYKKGQYGAYASPWSKFIDTSLRLGIDYSDTIIVNPNTFPSSSKISWHWPNRVSALTGVWGYMTVWFGNYDGGAPAVAVTPRQVKNIATLRQDFSLVQSGTGSYNTLNEFYLTSAAGNAAAKIIEIGYFLHGAPEGKHFRDTGRLIGTYTDVSGRNWEARMQGTFCMLQLTNGGDLLSGTIDVKATLNFLISKAVITGDEWFNGIAIGIEPVKGSGELQINQWLVTYN